MVDYLKGVIDDLLEVKKRRRMSLAVKNIFRIRPGDK